MADTAIDAIRFMRDTAIAAGTDIGSRIYMSIAPQNAALPFAVMEIISRVESPTQDSGSAVDVYRIQVDVFAKASTTASGFEQAHDIASNLRQAWSRQTDELTYDHAITGFQEVNHLTDFDPDYNAYRVSNDYMVRVNEEGGETMAEVIKVVKITKSYSELITEGGYRHALTTLAANAIIHNVAIRTITLFAGTSVSGVTATVGVNPDFDIYHSGASLTTNTTDISIKTNTETFSTSPIEVMTELTFGTGVIEGLTQGQVSFWIYYSILH
jgi:hypothetical protein